MNLWLRVAPRGGSDEKFPLVAVQLSARSAAIQDGATAYLQCLIDERAILGQEAQVNERKKKLAASLTREQISRAEQQVLVMPTPQTAPISDGTAEEVTPKKRSGSSG